MIPDRIGDHLRKMAKAGELYLAKPPHYVATYPADVLPEYAFTEDELREAIELIEPSVKTLIDPNSDEEVEPQ